MPNLIEELGADYCDQFYANALFADNKYLYSYKGSGAGEEGRKIRVARIPLDTTKPAPWGNTALDQSFFESMGTFAWPKLGYRQLIDEQGLRHVFYVSSQRSVYRGLRDEHITEDRLPIGTLVGTQMRGFHNSIYLPQIFKPKFTTYNDGLAELIAGEQSCFALSEDLAVGVSCTSARK